MLENLVPALIGIACFALFVGFLAYKIATLPLTLITVGVLALVAADFVRTLRA
jgi:hypothetical protein